MNLDSILGGYPSVFRFRSPSKWTLSELDEGYVYFANRNELNDPHDSNPRMVKFTEDTTELNKFYEYLASFFPNEESKIDFINNYDSSSLRDFMIEKIEFFILHFGVVCFSMHLKNFPMWANYTDNYKGLCLQFNVEKDPDLFSDIRPVKYIEKPTKIIYNPISDKDTLTELFFQKTNDWSSEKELRLLKVHNGRHDFRKEALERVFLGYNSKPKFIKKVKNIIQEKYPLTPLYLLKVPTEYEKLSFTLIS